MQLHKKCLWPRFSRGTKLIVHLQQFSLTTHCSTTYRARMNRVSLEKYYSKLQTIDKGTARDSGNEPDKQSSTTMPGKHDRCRGPIATQVTFFPRSLFSRPIHTGVYTAGTCQQSAVAPFVAPPL